MKEINEKFNKDRDVMRVQIQYFSDHYNKGTTIKHVQKWLELKWVIIFNYLVWPAYEVLLLFQISPDAVSLAVPHYF